MAISRMAIIRTAVLLLAVSAVAYAAWPAESGENLRVRLEQELPKGSDDETVKLVLQREFKNYTWDGSGNGYRAVGTSRHGFLSPRRFMVGVSMSNGKVVALHLTEFVPVKGEI
jgi:hypothetical protein